MRSTAPARTLFATVAFVLAPVLALDSPVRAGPGLSGRWAWPLQPIPRVVRYFDPPDSPYGPGHRGVDLAGKLGQQVYAIGAGRVRFAGSVAGRGVVVLDHGRLRSTYQPVLATVRPGASVTAGQRIGILELVHSHCLPDPCLHLGVLRGHRYIDPLTLLGPRPVVLKPLSRGGAGMPALPPRPGIPRSPPPGGGGHLRARYALPAHLGFPWEVLERPDG